MFITKKHLSRRTVLKGAGVTLALPFLEAMVPAATALAQTVAAPKMRTAFFYIPHGAIMYNTSHGPAMDKWTPAGAGADFKLSPILSALEPYKKYVTSFGNLENAASAGSVHTFNPATWLSATRPDTGSRRAHMATTLDQVIAKVIGQETPLPSCGSSSVRRPAMRTVPAIGLVQPTAPPSTPGFTDTERGGSRNVSMATSRSVALYAHHGRSASAIQAATPRSPS